MLSRVAERMYWLGRYVERIENTARLINVNLMLDVPQAGHVWGSMIEITGTREEYEARFSIVDERQVVKFLVADSAGSIAASIVNARENARTSREVLPREAWEYVNELHIYVRDNLPQINRQRGRVAFLQEVLHRCYAITGLLVGSMSAGEVNSFIRVGRNLERADMTTRIVDAGCFNLLDRRSELQDYENILWMSVLRSLSAYQMYRQHVQDRVNGEDVVDFLLCDRGFPRAVSHCLGEMARCFDELPNHELPLRAVSRTALYVDKADVSRLLVEDELHDFIDQLQFYFADLHTQISDVWFSLVRAAQDVGVDAAG